MWKYLQIMYAVSCVSWWVIHKRVNSQLNEICSTSECPISTHVNTGALHITNPNTRGVHSTLNFLKQSFLECIATWRKNYRPRTPSSPDTPHTSSSLLRPEETSSRTAREISRLAIVTHTSFYRGGVHAPHVSRWIFSWKKERMCPIVSHTRARRLEKSVTHGRFLIFIHTNGSASLFPRLTSKFSEEKNVKHVTNHQSEFGNCWRFCLEIYQTKSKKITLCLVI